MENSKKNKEVHFLELNGLTPAVFNINGHTKEFNIFELMKVGTLIQRHLKSCSILVEDLNFYRHFEKNLDELLDNMEEKFKSLPRAQKYYCVGNNFARFLDTAHEVPNSGGKRLCNNNEASKIIERDYKEAYGENTLKFDAEMSYCYVSTKSREEAKCFELFVYNKYIKPQLEPWYEGWDEFVKLWKETPQEDKNEFAFFNH
jgi:hypothetical protein